MLNNRTTKAASLQMWMRVSKGLEEPNLEYRIAYPPAGLRRTRTSSAHHLPVCVVLGHAGLPPFGLDAGEKGMDANAADGFESLSATPRFAFSPATAPPSRGSNGVDISIRQTTGRRRGGPFIILFIPHLRHGRGCAVFRRQLMSTFG